MCVAIRFTKSAGRHNITQADALYALTHAVNTQPIEGRDGQPTRVFVGRPHAQSRRYIEVIVAVTHTGDIVVFHAMELTDTWRHLVYEAGHTEWENE